MALFSRVTKKGNGIVSFAPIFADEARDNPQYATWIRNHRWTSRNEKWCRKQIGKFTYKPSIGILMQCMSPKEELLRDSLSSIFNQIYPFSELSVVDRGSSPHIKSVLDDLQRDPRVKVSFQKGSERDIDAIAKIMKKAVQEWLLLIGAEDILEPDALYNMVAYLQDTSEIDFVFSDSDMIDDQRLRFDPQFKPIWAVGASYPLGYYQHPVLLSRRQVAKLKGYETISALVEEGTLLDEASNHARYVVQAPGILYHARARGRKNEKPPAPVNNVLMNENFAVKNGVIEIDTEVRRCAEPRVPLRILWLIDSLNHQDGPTAWFHCIRYFSNESGHRFTVLSMRDGAIRPQFEKICNVEISRGEDIDSKIATLHAEQPFDVAIVSCVASFWLPEALHRLDIPTLWELYPEETDVAPDLEQRFQMPETIVFSDAVVAKNYKHLDSKGIVRILPTGVDLENLKIYKQRNSPFEWRAKFNLTPSTRLFTVVGPTIENKGQHNFVKAALEAIRRNPDQDLKFFIAGERPGPYLDELKKMISASGKSEYFRLFPEETDPFQYYPHYLITDVLVSCAKRDLFPLTTLEAMAMKKAVIATDVFATNTVVENEENGFLVPPDDPAELAERLDDLIKKPEFFDFFGRRSLEIIYEKFQFRKIARRFEDLLRESIVTDF